MGQGRYKSCLPAFRWTLSCVHRNCFGGAAAFWRVVPVPRFELLAGVLSRHIHPAGAGTCTGNRRIWLDGRGEGARDCDWLCPVGQPLRRAGNCGRLANHFDDRFRYRIPWKAIRYGCCRGNHRAQYPDVTRSSGPIPAHACCRSGASRSTRQASVCRAAPGVRAGRHSRGGSYHLSQSGLAALTAASPKELPR